MNERQRIETSAVPPNKGMELTVKNRRALCKRKSKGRAAFACSSSQALGGTRMSAQYIFVAVLVLVALGSAVFLERGRQSRLRAFWLRSCSGRAWKHAFPQTSKHEIRRFLYLFVDSFAFPRGRALQFLPSDRVLAVYRTLYPSNDLPDVLELETFAKQVDKEYGVSLNQLWSEELTLGQVFSSCRVPAA